ncbi:MULTISPECIES: hypothetical protein [unclassified Legionella]|uniref:hypothetical protein n=1 Tax=unclassified Legionella TaxID=2622702 RepID=UPI001E31D6FA|nr:hypothetical protein [Legionella sp. 31fI33]MCC5014575.1 hypothetical protein [Legionella sp. 31fI33]
MISAKPMEQLLAEDQALLRLNKITRIICETTNPDACNIQWNEAEKDLRFNFVLHMNEYSPATVHHELFSIIPFILGFPNPPKAVQGKNNFTVKVDTVNTEAVVLNRLMQHEVEAVLVGEQNFSYFTKYGLPHPKTGRGAMERVPSKAKRLFHERTMRPYGIKLTIKENNQVEIIVDAPGEPMMIAKTLCSIWSFPVNDVVVKERSLLFASVDAILDSMAVNRINYQSVLVLNKQGELAITECTSSLGEILGTREHCLEPYYPELDALGPGLRKMFGLELRDPRRLYEHSTIIAHENNWALFLVEADVWVAASAPTLVESPIPEAERFVSLSKIKEKGIFGQSAPLIQHYLYFEANRIESALQANEGLEGTMVTIDSSFQSNPDNIKRSQAGDNFGKIYIKNSDGRINLIYEAFKLSLPPTSYPNCQIELLVADNTVVLSNINPALVFHIVEIQTKMHFCFKQIEDALPASWIADHINTLMSALDKEPITIRLPIIDKTQAILTSCQQLIAQLPNFSGNEKQQLLKCFIAEVQAYEQSILALSPTQKTLLIAFTLVGTLLGVSLGSMFGLLGGFCLSSGANSAIPGLGMVAANYTGGGIGAALATLKGAGLTVMISTAASSFLVGIVSGTGTFLVGRLGFFSPSQSQLLVKTFSQKLQDDIKNDKLLQDSNGGVVPVKIGGSAVP